MIPYARPDYVCRNMTTLVDYVDPSLAKLDQRRAYFTCVQRIQQHDYDIVTGGDTYRLDFDASNRALRSIFEMHREESHDGQDETIEAFPEDEIRAVTARMRAALDFLATVDEEAPQAVRLLVGSFIFARVPRFAGGSFPRAIGTVWLNPPPDWSQVDYAEAILHETTHQAMYLDDMVNGIFNAPAEAMAGPDGVVVSPIRRVRRAYDLSFHAACVSVALIDFYTRLGDEEKVRSLREPLRPSLAELTEKARFLSAHGRIVLDELSHGM